MKFILLLLAATALALVRGVGREPLLGGERLLEPFQRIVDRVGQRDDFAWKPRHIDPDIAPAG